MRHDRQTGPSSCSQISAQQSLPLPLSSKGVRLHVTILPLWQHRLDNLGPEFPAWHSVLTTTQTSSPAASSFWRTKSVPREVCFAPVCGVHTQVQNKLYEGRLPLWSAYGVTAGPPHSMRRTQSASVDSSSCLVL